MKHMVDIVLDGYFSLFQLVFLVNLASGSQEN